MKKIAVALVALLFVLTSCSGNAGGNISGKTSIVAKTNANYVEYSESSVSETKGDKVIFFHAAWCSSCVNASKKISESSTIDNLTIFKVEFDDATTLREKYGVTTKHTFVQVDDKGEMIKKWSGSPDIADIQAKINGETSSSVSMTTGNNKNYIDYTQGVISKTQGDKVLFFHAAWCGTCVNASESFSENETTNNLVVYKVDFDNSTELRKKYGVTDKHTFVQVDQQGNMIAKWRGSNDIADIQKNIKTDTSANMEKTNKEKVLDLAHKMEKDAMNEVKAMYPDLAFVKTITKEDNLNLMGMMEEEWLYSAEHDITVVVCKSMNTPSYIFDGKNISDSELVKVKTDMKKMMDMMGEDGDMMSEHGNMMMDDMKMKGDSETSMMKKEGKFVAYSAQEVANTEGTKVLFFHAKWCPSCTGAAKNLSTSTAPEGLNVFKVDYDTSTELKKKYGIVGQHTFVHIDDNGVMLKRWFGSRSYEDILAQL